MTEDMRAKYAEQKAVALTRVVTAIGALTEDELLALPEKLQVAVLSWLVVTRSHQCTDLGALEKALFILRGG